MTQIIYFAVAVLFCYANARPEDYPPADVLELLKPFHDKCTQELGVTDDEIKNYKIEDKSEKMMCYMRCLGLESKWLSPENKLQVDFIMETRFDSMADVIKNFVENCKDVPDGTHECEKAYNLHKCEAETDPKHWFLP
uniref:Odorant binging protein n=1 Tax=Agrilus zanthoxylumi TaxID=2696312 RepID=A0A8A6HV76_9COLE|nr:odorant binging protein [Agrilus zanthoxylumi]